MLLAGCPTRTHCKNNGDCLDGFTCNHETEQCEPDPCFNHQPGDFLRCESGVLVQCDPTGHEEELVPSGEPGCNPDARRCNECAPGTAGCIGDTWTVCDASGLVDSEEECPGGCTLEGCDTSCGNGALDPGEVCDDGNNANGDGCSADCRSDESCGNGVTDAAAGEACDDGNTGPGDGCSAACQLEYCGNGTLDPGEACDDNNTVDGDGCSASCRSDETCGNGVVDVVTGETCDDGNLRSHDGCSSGCTAETSSWVRMTTTATASRTAQIPTATVTPAAPASPAWREPASSDLLPRPSPPPHPPSGATSGSPPPLPSARLGRPAMGTPPERPRSKEQPTGEGLPARLDALAPGEPLHREAGRRTEEVPQNQPPRPGRHPGRRPGHEERPQREVVP